jgi:hypothetical protein
LPIADPDLEHVVFGPQPAADRGCRSSSSRCRTGCCVLPSWRSRRSASPASTTPPSSFIWRRCWAYSVGYGRSFRAPPLLLGFVLGPMTQEHLRRAIVMAKRDPTVFVTRSISCIHYHYREYRGRDDGVRDEKATRRDYGMIEDNRGAEQSGVAIHCRHRPPSRAGPVRQGRCSIADRRSSPPRAASPPSRCGNKRPPPTRPKWVL